MTTEELSADGAARQRSIVVGVDGSDPARLALKWAADEAKLRGAFLHVVYAGTDAPKDVPDWFSPGDPVMSAVTAVVDDAVALVATSHPGVLARATPSGNRLVRHSSGRARRLTCWWSEPTAGEASAGCCSAPLAITASRGRPAPLWWSAPCLTTWAGPLLRRGSWWASMVLLDPTAPCSGHWPKPSVGGPRCLRSMRGTTHSMPAEHSARQINTRAWLPRSSSRLMGSPSTTNQICISMERFAVVLRWRRSAGV